MARAKPAGVTSRHGGAGDPRVAPTRSARPQPRLAVRADSLSHQVYELLCRGIASGRYRPGERILEKQMAAQLGISRTPVREALLRLEADGVVVCNSRRSYNVGVLTVEGVREIYQTLAILEGASAAMAARRVSPADIRRLERYNRAMEVAARRNDLPGFGNWNRRFHDVFLAKVANRTLQRACDGIRARLYTFPVRHSSLAEWLRKSVEEHREIIRLARKGDAPALGRYFRDVHWSFTKNRRYIQDAFDRDGQAAIYLW
ncbi:MAG TPA: GntR family transcriptional regulator [Candidatus Acidoferrales bacterium]|nr:GntR family transcriptional regulator [Candidatus Acidoferrales bacterium]